MLLTINVPIRLALEPTVSSNVAWPRFALVLPTEALTVKFTAVASLPFTDLANVTSNAFSVVVGFHTSTAF